MFGFWAKNERAVNEKISVGLTKTAFHLSPGPFWKAYQKEGPNLFFRNSWEKRSDALRKFSGVCWNYILQLLRRYDRRIIVSETLETFSRTWTSSKKLSTCFSKLRFRCAEQRSFCRKNPAGEKLQVWKNLSDTLRKTFDRFVMTAC